MSKNISIEMSIPKKVFLDAKLEAEKQGQIMNGLTIENINERDFFTICDYIDVTNYVNHLVISEECR